MLRYLPFLLVFSAPVLCQTIEPKPAEVGRVQIYDSYQIETPRIFQVDGFGQPVGYRGEVVGLTKDGVLVEENNRVRASTPVDLAAQGRIPTSSDQGVYGDDDHPFFEDLTETIASHAIRANAPSFQVAVARHGRLLYFRSFGWTGGDALLSNPVPVGSAARYRLASITKPITAWGLFRYWELHLRDTMSFDSFLHEVRPLDELADSPQFTPFADPQFVQVRIEDLLRHCAGFLAKNQYGFRNDANGGIWNHVWLRDEQGAGQFPLDLQELHSYYQGIPQLNSFIREYSNTGYYYLARYLEHKSGSRPDIWLREQLLRPLGIRATERGRSRLTERLDGEVIYQSSSMETNVLEENGPLVPGAYGSFSMEVLHGCSNLVGSAADVVRFAGIFDPAVPAPMFSQEMFDEAFQSFAEIGYTTHRDGASGKLMTDMSIAPAGGWKVTTGGNLSHSGDLPGTKNNLMQSRQTGIGFAILCNARSTMLGDTLSFDPVFGSVPGIESLNTKVFNWLDSREDDENWPHSLDLFGHYGYYSERDQEVTLSVSEQDLPATVHNQLDRRRFPMVVEGDDAGRQSVIFSNQFPNGAVSVVLARDFDFYLQQIQDQNQRIVSLDSYMAYGEPHYNFVVNAEYTAKPWHASAHKNITEFWNEFNQLSAQGYVIDDVSVVVDKGKLYLTTLYTKLFDTSCKVEFLAPGQVASKDAWFRSIGYHLSSVDSYIDSNQNTRLVCVWTAGQPDKTSLSIDQTATAFNNVHHDTTVGMTKIMRLADLAPVVLPDGTTHYSGIWANETNPE